MTEYEGLDVKQRPDQSQALNRDCWDPMSTSVLQLCQGESVSKVESRKERGSCTGPAGGFFDRERAADNALVAAPSTAQLLNHVTFTAHGYSRS